MSAADRNATRLRRLASDLRSEADHLDKRASGMRAEASFLDSEAGEILAAMYERGVQGQDPYDDVLSPDECEREDAALHHERAARGFAACIRKIPGLERAADELERYHFPDEAFEEDPDPDRALIDPEHRP